MNTTRREFLAASAAAAALGPRRRSATAPLGANDTIVAALLGAGRQGTYDMLDHIRQGNVEIAAVCDVYEPHLNRGLSQARTQSQRLGLTAIPARGYHDYRHVLDRKDIDVIIVGSPDHWHPLMTIQACEAGKDVYVEKPICVRVEEGHRMLAVARRTGRVVQVGTQQRSASIFQKAVELVWAGQIGKVTFARTWNYTNEYPLGIGNPPDTNPPAGLDWEMWQGPAPAHPFNWNRFGPSPEPLTHWPGYPPGRWSTFRYFWDYAGGWMTDWGVHLLDIVQWALRAQGPGVITASGGKYLLQDNRETPDTLQVTYEYRFPPYPYDASNIAEPGPTGRPAGPPVHHDHGCVVTYENRLCNANSMYGKSYGIEFHGTDGTLFVDRSGLKLIPEKRTPAMPNQYPTAFRSAPFTEAAAMGNVEGSHFRHVANFLECVRTRQRPISDIEIGMDSTTTCLLGNVAYRTGERLEWDSQRRQLTRGSAAARALLAAHYRAPWKLG